MLSNICLQQFISCEIETSVNDLFKNEVEMSKLSNALAPLNGMIGSVDNTWEGLDLSLKVK